MPLTDTAIRNAKPRGKSYKLADGAGLYLEVMPNGSRYWRMRYRIAGKDTRLAFGVYPEVSLAEARARRDDARRALREGCDPAAERRAAGMTVRREVLGDAHVDRATAAATDLTREFQEFITDYAWGGIWTRPGIDRRSRSMITLTALIARGHDEELEMHLRAARTNGLSIDEIKELILQTAIYCGVPDANTAFRIAQRTFEDEKDDD